MSQFGSPTRTGSNRTAAGGRLRTPTRQSQQQPQHAATAATSSHTLAGTSTLAVPATHTPIGSTSSGPVVNRSSYHSSTAGAGGTGPMTPFSHGSSLPPTPSSATGRASRQQELTVDSSGYSDQNILFSSAVWADEDDPADEEFNPDEDEDEDDDDDEEDELEDDDGMNSSVGGGGGTGSLQRQDTGVARRTRAQHSLHNVTFEELELQLPPLDWEEDLPTGQQHQDQLQQQQFDQLQAANANLFDNDLFTSSPPIPLASAAANPIDSTSTGHQHDLEYNRFRQLLAADNLDELDDDDDGEFQPDDLMDEDDEEEYRNDRSVRISKKEVRFLKSDRERNLDPSPPAPLPLPTRGAMSTRRREGNLSKPIPPPSNSTANSAITGTNGFLHQSPSPAAPTTNPPLVTSTSRRSTAPPATSSIFASDYSSIPTSVARLQTQTTATSSSMNITSNELGPLLSDAHDTNMTFDSTTHFNGLPANNTNVNGSMFGLPPASSFSLPKFPMDPMQFASMLPFFQMMQPLMQPPPMMMPPPSNIKAPIPATIVSVPQVAVAALPPPPPPQPPPPPPGPPRRIAHWTSAQRQMLHDQLSDHLQLLVQLRYLSHNSILAPLPPTTRQKKRRGLMATASDADESIDADDHSATREPLLSLSQIWDRTTELLDQLITRRDSSLVTWKKDAEKKQHEDLLDPYATSNISLEDTRPVLSLLPMLDVWQQLRLTQESKHTHYEFCQIQDRFLPYTLQCRFERLTRHKKLIRPESMVEMKTLDTETMARPWSEKTEWFYTPLLYAFMCADRQLMLRRDLFPRISRIYLRVVWTPAEIQLLDYGLHLYGRDGSKSVNTFNEGADWPTIRKLYLPGRTVIEISKYHANRLAQQKAKQNSLMTGEPISDIFLREPGDASSDSDDSESNESDHDMREMKDSRSTAAYSRLTRAMNLAQMASEVSKKAVLSKVHVFTNPAPLLTKRFLTARPSPIINQTNTVAPPKSQLSLPTSDEHEEQKESSRSTASRVDLSPPLPIPATVAPAPASRRPGVRGVIKRQITSDEIALLRSALDYFPPSHPRRWSAIVDTFLPSWDRLSLRRAWVRLEREEWEAQVGASKKRKHKPHQPSKFTTRWIAPPPPPPPQQRGRKKRKTVDARILAINQPITESLPSQPASQSQTVSPSSPSDEIDLTQEEKTTEQDVIAPSPSISTPPITIIPTHPTATAHPSSASSTHSVAPAASNNFLPSSHFIPTATSTTANAMHDEVGDIEDDEEEEKDTTTQPSSVPNSADDRGVAPMVIDDEPDHEQAPTSMKPASIASTKPSNPADSHLADAIIALRSNSNPSPATAGGGLTTPIKSKPPQRSPSDLLQPTIVNLAHTSELVETTPAPLLAPVQEQLTYSVEQYAYASASLPIQSPVKKPSRSHSRQSTPVLNRQPSNTETATTPVQPSHMRLRQNTPDRLARASSADMPPSSLPSALTRSPSIPPNLPIATRPLPTCARSLARTNLTDKLPIPTMSNSWLRLSGPTTAAMVQHQLAGTRSSSISAPPPHPLAANDGSAVNPSATIVDPSPRASDSSYDLPNSWSSSEEVALLLAAKQHGDLQKWPTELVESMRKGTNEHPPRTVNQLKQKLRTILQELQKNAS